MDLVLKYLLFICLGLLGSCSEEEPNKLQDILNQERDHPLLNEVLDNTDKYELQIIYTEVKKDDSGSEKLVRHDYRIDTTAYFYPASTIKMPTAFIALEQLSEWQKQIPSIDLDTRIRFDSVRPPQSSFDRDSCSISGYPTLRSLVTTLFVISDNNAYNRLYELVGQERINQSLYDKNIFTNSIIRTRVGVGGFSLEENQHSSDITFIADNGEELYHLPSRQSIFNKRVDIQKTKKGKGYYSDELGKVIEQPFDMGEKNFINLADLDRSLKHLIKPDLFPEQERYKMDHSTRTFLLDAMQKLPSEVPCYQPNLNYYDGYVKLLLYGDTKDPIPSHINIYNKVGFAYGYLIDVAFIEDTKNDIGFFLSAALHVNENQIYNDGVYEYDSIGIPFLAELGRQVYTYELEKEK